MHKVFKHFTNIAEVTLLEASSIVWFSAKKTHVSNEKEITLTDQEFQI